MTATPEVWLRGPVEGVIAWLQPVGHSLLQCQEEVHAHVPLLTPEQIWRRPNDAASVGFHVRHAAGSLGRLFTYARGEQLSGEQMTELKTEAEPDHAPDAAMRLITAFDRAIDKALAQLRQADETTLRETRSVGRAQLPSTTIGLLFHGAEHTQRHVGQMVTTAKIVRTVARVGGAL